MRLKKLNAWAKIYCVGGDKLVKIRKDKETSK